MIGRLFRSWGARVAVEGRSMAPTLLPGDWLLADPDAYRDSPPRVGDLVLVPDPRDPSRLLVKRVAEVVDGTLSVAGDSPGESTDSRAFGPVEASVVEGRPWFRYWPLHRWGRIV
ncbi:MAG: nickel-type superoxide dismutase maturation protease [Chloroflexota bacterium]|nr:nickel-type superoxide dismutase maturation protease [Chloroflexota bacterium]